MADQTRVVETVFEVQGERAARQLGLLDRAAGSVTRTMDRASGMVGRIGGALGVAFGAFSAYDVVSQTMSYFRTIDRVTRVTGLAAEKASALTEAMELSGVEDAEMILFRLSKRAEQVGGAMGQGAGRAGREMKRLGIDLRKGPEESLLAMAKAAKEGKLSAAGLGRMLMIRPEQALRLQEMIERGPEGVKKMMAEALKSGAFADAKSLATFRNLQQARRELADAWQDVQVTIGKRVMPVAVRLIESIKQRLEGWLPVADKFGQMLERHLEGGLGLATTIGKVLIANYAMTRVTGAGIVTQAARAGRWVTGAGGVAGLLGGLRGGGAGAAPAPIWTGAPGAMDWSKWDRAGRSLERLNRGPEKISAVARALERAQGGLTRFIPLLGAVGRLTLLGGGFLGVLGVAAGILQSMRDEGTQAAKDWDETFATFSKINIEVGSIFGARGTFTQFLADTTAMLAKLGVRRVAGYVERAGAETDLPWWKVGVRAGTRALKYAVPFGQQVGWMPWETEVEAEVAARRRARETIYRPLLGPEAAPKGYQPPAARDKQPYYDFRGSRFDILQKFEEGFDPDRIAVAFADDLATLGEARVQSNFAPLFSTY